MAERELLHVVVVDEAAFGLDGLKTGERFARDREHALDVGANVGMKARVAIVARGGRLHRHRGGFALFPRRLLAERDPTRPGTVFAGKLGERRAKQAHVVTRPAGRVGIEVDCRNRAPDRLAQRLASLIAARDLGEIAEKPVLVRTIQDRAEAGESFPRAVVGGTCDRLRAVILTSVTTIFGLLPLLFETSLQAQFLKPMAVTITFGLMGSTLIVLVLVPALLMVQHDIEALFRRRRAAQPG